VNTQEEEEIDREGELSVGPRGVRRARVEVCSNRPKSKRKS